MKKTIYFKVIECENYKNSPGSVKDHSLSVIAKRHGLKCAKHIKIYTISLTRQIFTGDLANY